MVRPLKPANNDTRSKAKAKPSGLLGWFTRWRSATRRAEARAVDKTTAKTTPAKQKKPKGHAALVLEIDPLFLVRGVDGLLRGAPDPTMVVCAWTLGPQGVQTILRSVLRFDVKDGVPGPAVPDAGRLKSTAVARGAPVLVFIALFEENRGDDIQRLVSALEHPEHLHFVELSHGTPHVVSADDAFADDTLATLAVRGVVLADGSDPSRTTTDTWVGGAAVVVKRKPRQAHRINLRTADGTQDWIVALATSRA